MSSLTNEKSGASLVSPLRYCTNHILARLLTSIKPPQNVDVLDIGCGGGYHSLLAENGYRGNYLGVDKILHPGWEESANQGLTISFRQLDAHRIKDLMQNFDIILSIQSLEHMIDDVAVINGMAQLLKKGGCILLTVPSEHSHWLYGHHGERRYTKKEIFRLARQSALEVRTVTDVGGAATFCLHFLFWSIPSIAMGIPIWKIYEKSMFLTRMIRFLEKTAARIDRGLPALPGGYAVILAMD